MKLDIASSTVELAGRRWPAVGVLCPCDSDDCCSGSGVNPEWRHSLGDLRDGVELVYVPLENGLLIQLDRDPDAGLSARSEYRKAAKFDFHNCSWLPASAFIERDRATVHSRTTYTYTGAPHAWHKCEEDWLNEHIDRLSRLQVVEQLDAVGDQLRSVALLSLKRLEEIFKRNCVQPS